MPTNTQRALFALRISIAVFCSVWAIEKFVKPETTAAIWSKFYLVDRLPTEVAYIIGAIQLLAVVLFALGLFKLWTYGFFLTIHALGTLSTWQILITPYQGSNHLFVAAIPLLGALLALFLMRRDDTWLSLG
ncbi:hypothetical protein L53_10125 [Hyphomonas sp. L-53-1-40]|uniref:hypothetical protein n=1 Tax=Hyphomonas sp. L-53-1-40 TaxID=1207058 RepID=UPI000458CBE0|nr:hypothetical protein [Hyphomonas sp. L-53-1-40]KCZ62922.1 hypothetical protein L53_10125 [Hyphomonas sp. L-53-1-40]